LCASRPTRRRSWANSIGQAVRFEGSRDLFAVRGDKLGGDRCCPALAHGYVLRSPHAHAKNPCDQDRQRPRAAPGVIDRLTGADWMASVGGKCRAGRAQAAPMDRRDIGRVSRSAPYPSRTACAGLRLVASWWRKTTAVQQPMRGTHRGESGASHHRREEDDVKKGAPLGWRLTRQICLVQIDGDKGSGRRGFRECRPCGQAPLCMYQSRHGGR